MKKSPIQYSSIEELKHELNQPNWSLPDFIDCIIPGGTKLMFFLYLEKTYTLKQGEYAKEIIEPLILEGEEVNALNRQNNPTIIYASSIETLDLLIKYGANINMPVDNKENLLDYYIRKASFYGLNEYESMLTYLLEKGLKPTAIETHLNTDWLIPLLEKIELSDIVNNNSSVVKVKI